MDWQTFLSENWYTMLTSVVVIASLITAGTETPDPDTKLGRIYRVIEYLGLVIGKAKQEKRELNQ